MQAPDPINNRKTTEFKHVTPPEALPDVSESQVDVTSVKDTRLFINREMSLLAFQWRVLEEVRDESNPLLERIKFLAIVGSNLDEFFMVRVAGLKAQIEAGSVAAGPDGLTPREQVGALSAEVAKLMDAAEECLRDSLMPALIQAGVRIYDYHELTPQQQSEVNDYFV